MTKHTPGPWTVIKFTDMGAAFYDIKKRYENGYGDIGSTSPYTSEYAVMGSDECERANAHLIAAAPDLLKACIDAKQAMNNILEYGLFKEPQSERELLSFRTQLAQAIAKANGET